MTFMLRDSQPVAPNPDAPPLTTFWDATRAAGGMEWQDADVARQRARQVATETQGMVEQVYPLLGEQAVLQRLKERGLVPEVMVALPPDALRYNQRAKAEVLAMAREAAEAEPDKWAGMDLSEEGIEARVTERRAKELAENEAILAMSPMPGLAGFVGTVGAAMVDPVNIGLSMLSGGGGSLLRVMGREASVNATAEALSLPARFRTAEELGKEAPSIIETLAIGAAGGAILGGAMEGLSRGFAYLRTRETVTPVPGLEPVRHAAALQAAEDAMVAGENPVEAVEAVLQPRSEPQTAETEPRVAEVAPPAREPLVPDPVAPAAIMDPFERIAAPASPEELAAAQEALAMARADDIRSKRPLSEWIRGSAPPTPAQVEKAKRLGRKLNIREDYRIDPDGPLGQELKARGVNSKTMPGIWKKGGRGDLDNLVASEMEDNFPGIMAATGTPYGETYLDYEGLRELLIRDAQGDASWLLSRADVLAAERAAYELENPNRTISALDQYQGKERADDGFFVDDMTFFDDPDGVAMERGFDMWLERRGLNAVLTPSERAEVLAQLRKDGGDAEYLVERVLEREQDWIDGPEDAATDGLAAAGGSGDFPPWDFPGQAGSGAARAEGGGLAPERTAAEPVRPDPDKPGLIDTRGQGIRFHGSRSHKLDGRLDEGAYSTQNYYGQGFYTTDAIAIADGYDKGGGIYVVDEMVPVRAFDMEQPIPDFLRRVAEAESGDAAEAVLSALDENPATVREFYDAIRDYSRSNQIPADEIQGVFETFEFTFKENGFNALDHRGGLLTKKAEHAVRIYFDPHETVSVRPVDKADYATPVATERTAAGEQALIPGVAPVTERQRLEAARPAARPPQEPDSQIGGMFDLAALSMRDMFDDPEGPKAQAFLDSMVVDLKAELEAGPGDLDFRAEGDLFVGMTTEEGTPITSLQQLVDEIEANDTLAREIELCRTGGAQ